MDKRPSVSFN